jgi:hypothetical protein
MKMFSCLIKYRAIKSRSGGITPCILNLGTRWRWMVSFTPWALYTRGKSPRYPLDRRFGGPQSLSERGGEEKNSYHSPYRELNPGHQACSLVPMLTELPRLFTLLKDQLSHKHKTNISVPEKWYWNHRKRWQRQPKCPFSLLRMFGFHWFWVVTILWHV